MFKVGIDLGGTNIKFGFFDLNSNLIEKRSKKTSKIKDEIVSDIINEIKKVIKDDKVLGITLAIPGVILNDKVIYAPNTNILDLNFKEILEKEFNTKNIIIDNDANLAALAEAKLTNTKDLVLITLGTGVGGGIVIDNKIHNLNGFAGEIGHIKVDLSKNARLCGCGKKGCLEAYSSAKTIVLEFNTKANANINSVNLMHLFRNNNSLAKLTVKNSMKRLALAISNISATLGIKDFRLSGGLSNASDVIIPLVNKYYKEYALKDLEDAKIDVAKLGSEAGIYAAKYLI